MFRGIGRKLPAGIPGRYALERRVRWIIQDLERRRQDQRFGSAVRKSQPVLLGVSIPKSGTNLLRQVLSGLRSHGPFTDAAAMTILTFEVESGIRRPAESILEDLRSFQAGDIVSAHLYPEPTIVQEILTTQYASIFIYRDPRDVVLSHMHYIAHMRRAHVHRAYYTNELKTDEERLMTSIVGYKHGGIELPNIYERTSPYLGWLKLERVLKVRFEDLILDTEQAVSKIYEHLLLHGCTFALPKDEVIRTMISAIDPSTSRTFREGKVGAWRAHFTDEMNNRFREICGDLLDEMGYAKDY
jgi:hypothetical protein